jgi:hypothetical protein
MRSARCEAPPVYPIKDNTKHKFPEKVEREGVNGLRGEENAVDGAEK